LELIAYEYLYYKSVITELFPNLKLKETRVIGGGAKSDLWNQKKSDVLNIPYVRLNREEFGVLGLAIIAGYGIGFYNSMTKTA
jgi:xylulokinase